jgi:hypothetical protein
MNFLAADPPASATNPFTTPLYVLEYVHNVATPIVHVYVLDYGIAIVCTRVHIM